ncbi:unnamed protein product, partial [Phaeothamnion confervicola]
MGPQHPSTHGVLRMLLKMDGERCLACDPVVGYLHRSIEKMSENRTFTQFIPVTDRLDYCTSMTSNYVYVLAVEKLADISPPPRAEYIRVIMTELNRIASHLLWYGTFCLEIGATTPFLYSFRDREKVLDLFEAVCGARLLYNYVRVGGVAHDVSRGWLEKVIEFLDYWEPIIPEYEQLLDENPIFYNRAQGVGPVPLALARTYGVSGPNIRACGQKEDVRRDDPFAVYSELDFDIPVEQESDVYARYRVRMRELRESAKILRQVFEKIPSGAFGLPLNYRFKVPQGETYVHIESPRGDIGCYLVSDGGDKPYRTKFRTPSFCHIALFPELLKGVLIPDIM